MDEERARDYYVWRLYWQERLEKTLAEWRRELGNDKDPKISGENTQAKVEERKQEWHRMVSEIEGRLGVPKTDVFDGRECYFYPEIPEGKAEVRFRWNVLLSSSAKKKSKRLWRG